MPSRPWWPINSVKGTSVPEARPASRRYDRRQLTYSGTFDTPAQRAVISAVEWMTGKVTILRRVAMFERQGAPTGQAFWGAALDAMGIELQTPDAELRRIPREGPVVLVANHPHGLVDGVVLAELIGRVRPDYRILTRSLLTGFDETATSYMIPVPFPHQPDAQDRMLEMRARAMAHLGQGGLVALFPSGVIATSGAMFGPVVEAPWNVFTAQMIRRSGAAVVPTFFPGANSRAYQIANRLSATLRQSLLLHEIAHALDRPQRPVVGHAIEHDALRDRLKAPREFIAWLRQETLNLRDEL